MAALLGPPLDVVKGDAGSGRLGPVPGGGEALLHVRNTSTRPPRPRIPVAGVVLIRPESDSRRGYCRSMPRVSTFYGVAIYMYWNERDHPVAHFHAYHAGRRASVSAEGEVLAGGLDPRALQFVREWAVLRRGEITANWERARRNEPLLGIDPLA